MVYRLLHLNDMVFVSRKIVLVIENNAEHEKMPHCVAFYLGLHCLSNYSFMGINKRVKAPHHCQIYRAY